MCNIDVKCPYHRAGTKAASDVKIAIEHWTPLHIVMAQIKTFTVKVCSSERKRLAGCVCYGLALYMSVCPKTAHLPVSFSDSIQVQKKEVIIH